MSSTRFRGLVAFTISLSYIHICSGMSPTSTETSAHLGFEHSKMQELVETAGYPLEEHFVTTEDGYVLGLYRIPYGRNLEKTRRQQRFQGAQNDMAFAPGPPVLLQHGLLDSSATFVVNFPHQSLGFILADHGYDVWLGNSRGNAFSRNHTGFQPTGPTSSFFWDFSFDDMADYDIPAVVQYILSNIDSQKYRKVAYVGHSQGGTQAFASFSAKPELQNKIAVLVALAPAIFLRYTSSIPFLILAQLHTDQLFDMLGQHEFLPARKATADLFSEVCKTSPLACISVLTAICGFNPHNLNLTRLPTYVEYAPSGTSVKNMAHWAQLIRQSGEERTSLFRRYNYGNKCFTSRGAPQNCNRRIYGDDFNDTPPSFNLSALTEVPIAIFSGVQDILADPIDIEALVEALPSGALVYLQSEISFEHIDFTWGLSSAEKIYPQVVRLLDEYLREEQEKEEESLYRF
jgi:pimeloyl-ACP methyl ester carboxylesterase